MTCEYCGNSITSSKCTCYISNHEALSRAPVIGLMLLTADVKILSDHLKNEYLTHDEPARSVLLKIHSFADKNS
jgi:hypothetical protein